MKRKAWIGAALSLIIIGGVGMAANDFKFDNNYQSYKYTWTIEAESAVSPLTLNQSSESDNEPTQIIEGLSTL